jgi:uracil-DNA glycosylase family 4
MAGLHNSGRDDMAKKSIALPPPPAGKIAALPPLTRAEKIAQLAALEQTVKTDLAGLLNNEIKNVVFGEGDPEAPIIFIGEGPGVEEDIQGRPFVGKSGQKLDEMIKAMGYARQQVYIANVVKVRCAAWSEVMHRMVDRPPEATEAAAQLGYLFRQIEIIRPRAIVTLGNPALHFFLQLQAGILSVRGQWQDHRGIPAMPTFHPAYLLRNYTPETRNMMWSDLKQVMTLLAAK